MTNAPPSPDAHAVCGAYLMVAFADGQFDSIEEARFLGGVANEPALSFLSAIALEECYNTLVSAFKTDYNVAAHDVLQSVRNMKKNASVVEAVLLAARTAIVADQEVLPQEEIALEQIAKALGLEKGTL